MKLKEYLERYLKELIEEGIVVRVADVEYMQGVDLMTDKPGIKPETIINDRPVKKFWDFKVVGTKRAAGCHWVLIKGEEELIN